MPLYVILIVIFGMLAAFLSYRIIYALTSPKRLSSIPELIKQGKYAAAEKAAKAIVVKDPRNTAAHYYLAQTYLAEGKSELALMELKTINDIGIFNDFVPETAFRKMTADLYERFGQLEEALKEYILLATKDPGNADYYYKCAKIFNDRNKPDVAAKYARKAIELAPRHAKAHYTFGVILYKQKNFVDAKIEFDTALKLDSANYDGYFYLGKILKESNDYHGALQAFERAQKSPELKLKALIERGGTYMNQGSYENASIELERAVKLSKDESSTETLYARYFLSICYEKMKKIDLAIEQWEKIHSKKQRFKDVAEKLAHYQEYRTDDRMKDYLTCGREEFAELCAAIINTFFGLTIRDSIETKNGVDFIAVEGESDKWLAAKKMPRLLRFVRVSEPLDDAAVRNFLDNMKKQSIVRGVIVTSSMFTRTASEFAENRSVDLYNKDQLAELLKQAAT